MIPGNISHLRFVKILRGSKKAFEDDWQNHPYSAQEIAPWISDGNNYGIICDKNDGIGMIDADCGIIVDLVDNFLPSTFSVRSSSDSKRHFYYKITGFPADKNKITFINPSNPDAKGKEGQGGDVRLGNFYVVGPGSIHPDTKLPYTVATDAPIAEVSFDQIFNVLGSYFKTPIIETFKSTYKHGLSIENVINHYNIPVKSRMKDATELYCSHPIHGSEGGSNFGVNVAKNVWCCRRHSTGGSSFHLVAVMEHLIDCADVTKKLPDEVLTKVTGIIKEKFGTESALSWDVTSTGTLKGSYNNCINFFETTPDFTVKFNQFSSEIEVNKERLDDKHLILVKESMRKIQLEPSIQTIDEALKTIAFRNQYHPVKEWIMDLKWDGNERCNYWLSYFCGAANNEYTQFVARTIILAIVNRVFRPGCQYDHMPILEGEQGIGKSSVIRVLGGEWYKEVSLIERDRDTVQKLQGAIIVEVAELAAFAKRDIDSLKAFITHPSDFARFAYARNDKKYPRQSTFIGTVNPDETGYLNDTTGNRRFLPVLIARADIIGLINARDQLFAEAYQLYLKGVNIYFNDKKMLLMAKEQQELREPVDPWAECIIKWARTQTPEILENVTCMNIYINVLGERKGTCDKRITGRIANILKKLGCKKAVLKRIDGELGRFWDLSNLVTPPVAKTVDYEN